MSKLCNGRVCIVTGAGRGIGRAYALQLADHGARVVVNDVGGARDGAGSSASPASDVVEEIVARGGAAIANHDDVADWDAAEALVAAAVDEFGRLDVVVNNAGILRDRMLTNMSEAEWDDVIRVHLKGTAAPAHHAAVYWRTEHKAGREVDARLINTTSVSGIYGNPGQSNYGAAKAGIAAFTYIASLELQRYGVTVNAIAPNALTRMTEDLAPQGRSTEQVAALSPEWIAPVVCYLASASSAHVNGAVIESSGHVLAVAEGWHRGPTAEPTDDANAVGEILDHLLFEARSPADMSGRDRD